MERYNINLRVNGEWVEVSVGSGETLLDTLRERLELTGAKEGCGLGACGSCTVLLNGQATRSCIVMTAELDGAEVESIEGLADGARLDPLQESFMEKGAVQCGFCTPGMIMTAKGLLNRNPKADKGDVIRTMSSNLCRCTGYKKIVEAVDAVSSTETSKIE